MVSREDESELKIYHFDLREDDGGNFGEIAHLSQAL
jgi:hypothetical protein